MTAEAPIDRLECAVYRIATDMPEGGGTFEWNATTMIVVNLHAGKTVGTGYTCLCRASDRLCLEACGRRQRCA